MHDSQRMSQHALIAFASRYGQTERIALRIGKILSDAGASVDFADLSRVKARLDGYDIVVLAGGIYFGKHPRALERFARANHEALSKIESVLVSVSGAAGSAPGMKEAERFVEVLTQRTGWTPKRTLLAAGATSYTKYNFLLRWMMRRIAAAHGQETDTSRDCEFTYWPEVEEFARALARAEEPVAP